MSKFSNMFSIFDKKKKKEKEKNLGDLGFFFNDDVDEPTSTQKPSNIQPQNINNNPPKDFNLNQKTQDTQKNVNSISNKMNIFETKKVKEEPKIEEKKQETKTKQLFFDSDDDDIFKKPKPKEEKKIVGLFANLDTFSPPKPPSEKNETKEENKKIEDVSSKTSILEKGNQNLENKEIIEKKDEDKNNNRKVSDNLKDRLNIFNVSTSDNKNEVITKKDDNLKNEEPKISNNDEIINNNKDSDKIEKIENKPINTNLEVKENTEIKEEKNDINKVEINKKVNIFEECFNQENDMKEKDILKEDPQKHDNIIHNINF